MSKVRLYGATSGYVELAAPDVADDATLTLPTGTAGFLAGNGGIGTNVVQTSKTDTFITSSTTYTDVTGLTATITPTTNTSKILVVAFFNYSGAGDGYGQAFRINGGNASNFVGGGSGSRMQGAVGARNRTSLFATNESQQQATIAYLDSPATTSPVTYALQARVNNAASAVWVNLSVSEVNSSNFTRTASSIIAIEVAA